MKLFFWIMNIFLIIFMLIGCASNKNLTESSNPDLQKDNAITDREDSNDPQLVDNPADLLPVQRQQMADMFKDNNELLQSVFDFISADDGILYIRADGYVVYNDKSQKWVDEISPQIKTIGNSEGKDYTNISFKAWENDGEILFIEAYYPKTQTVYNVLYSESELDSGSFWYTKLDENWYLLETPMT